MSGLRFTDGTKTVVINDPTVGVLRQVTYKPQTPEIEKIEYTDAFGDGGEQPVSTYRNITEPVDVFINDGTVRTVIQDLQYLFEEARYYQRKKAGKQVWMEFRYQDTDTWWRSEVLAGKLEFDDTLLSWGAELGMAIFSIIVTRRHYWEGTEVSATLANGHGTGTTVQVWNQDTATKDNWVQITGIEGDLPAPCKLSMQNTSLGPSGQDSRTITVWVGQSGVILPAAGYLALQGEGMNGVYAQNTTQSFPDFSNGVARVWWLSGNVTTKIGYWTLSAAQMASLLGGYYKMLLHGTFLGNVSIRLSLMIEQITTMWKGNWTKISLQSPTSSPYEVDTIQLPPYLLDTTDSLYPLDLTVEMRSEGSATLNLDWLQLLPTESWTAIVPRGYDQGSFVTLVSDQTADTAYTSGWATAGKLGNYVRTGPGVTLKPGRTNRLHFGWGGSSGSSDRYANRSMNVSVTYRPRRISL